MRARALLLVLVGLTAACGERGCSCARTRSEVEWTRVQGEDGEELRLVERGPYRAYYDTQGRLKRVEVDSNEDGKVDNIAYHDGSERPILLEVDTNFDGVIDRWEHYDEQGQLVKVGSASGGGPPERWAYLGPDGLPVRMEYDADANGKVERIEIFEEGRIVAVETDTDRDGQIDRWQDWRSGILGFEEFDTDGDGRRDRRLRYGAAGQIESVEPIEDE